MKANTTPTSRALGLSVAETNTPAPQHRNVTWLLALGCHPSAAPAAEHPGGSPVSRTFCATSAEFGTEGEHWARSWRTQPKPAHHRDVQFLAR